jgi:pimeloyl-ACP methyl ester carboxylesterase
VSDHTTAFAFSSDGTRIAYRIHGTGSRVLVLIHGWMASGAVFDELVAALPMSALRVLTVDLRGTGESEAARTSHSLQSQAEDVLCAMDAAGVERAVLLGHSMGGQIAQLLAASAPARVLGVLAVSPVPAQGLPLPENVAAMFSQAGGNADALGGILDMASPGLAKPERARLLADALRISPRCIAEAFAAWSTGGFHAQLAAIRVPVLVVGSDDAFLPPDLLQAQVVDPIAGARMTKVDGAGHYVQNEKPTELGRVIDAFIAGLPDAGRH